MTVPSPVIFPQVIFGLAKHVVCFSIRTDDFDLSRFLQRLQHFNLVLEILNEDGFGRERTMIAVIAILVIKADMQKLINKRKSESVDKTTILTCIAASFGSMG